MANPSGCDCSANAAYKNERVSGNTTTMPSRFFPMKRLILTITVLFAYASAAWAAPPVTLTTLRAIRALSNAEASNGLPVAFEATVTYYRGYEHTLFVQDGEAAIYVTYPTDLKLIPGDRVLVQGKTRSSFNPIEIGRASCRERAVGNISWTA